MAISIQTALVLISPLYAAILDLWRRTLGREGDVESNADDVEEIVQTLEQIDRRLDEDVATAEDIDNVRELIDALHEEAEILHDNVIDHNPCVYERATGECPFCESKDS